MDGFGRAENRSGASRGGKSELHRARRCVTQVCSTGIHTGGTVQAVSTDSATENKQPGASRVMVKRCGKSAPREAQATRHGKPRRVQGQIGNRGAARSASAKAAGFGYRSLRQMILSARKSADRIRLTALPKPIPQSVAAGVSRLISIIHHRQV